jgi:hypothetical protein
MIKWFAEFILRSRGNALLIATATFVLPLASWLSNIVIALVVLRHGWREGLWIVLSLVLVISVLFAISDAVPLNMLPVLLSGPLIVWGLAVVLRAFHSWSLVLVSAFYGGGALTFIFKVALGVDVGNIVGNLAIYQQYPELVVIMNLMLVVVLLFGALLSLALARGMQAMLFNPGGLYREIIQIRLPLHVAIVSLLVVTALMLGVTEVKDLVPVVILVYFLAGLSIIHFALQMVHKAWPWLVGFYAFFAWVFIYMAWVFIYMIMAVAALGLTDTFVDIRRRLSARIS